MESGRLYYGRYLIEREIGRGNFGVVYLARDVETDRRLAVKELLPWTGADASGRHRLRREARLARMLKSPHALRIFDLCQHDEMAPCIVMEYLEGEELSAILRREGRLPPDRVARIARQTLSALAEAHALGIVHRDLKPENIFICQDDRQRDFVKVFDFGIAKVAGTDDGTGLMETTKLTVAGGVMGTPVYMSPEQCRGDDLTPASDLYSLGIVFYEALAGRVPFDDENPVRILLMHNSDPVPPLPDDVAGTSLGRAIARALEKDPQSRFATAEEFLAVIEESSAAEPSPGSRPTPIPADAPPTGSPTAPTGSLAARPLSDARGDNEIGHMRLLTYLLAGAVLIVAMLLLAGQIF